MDQPFDVMPLTALDDMPGSIHINIMKLAIPPPRRRQSAAVKNGILSGAGTGNGPFIAQITVDK
ncbi:hypothetical protein D3C78_1873370 [compost metagenome]